MFKIGDKVECIKSFIGYGKPQAGEIFTITSVQDGWIGFPLPRFSYNERVKDGTLPNWNALDFKLVKENIIVKEKPYKFIDSEMNVVIDCDDTLVMWDAQTPYEFMSLEDQKKYKFADMITILDPYQNDLPQTLRKNNAHIQLLKQYYARGYYITVWSAGGALWAKAVVDALGLENYVHEVRAKPIKYVDDLPGDKILGTRVYLTEKS